jgi:anaerobic magnesium-protoporphyrin IX monomethyl ester cyclase
MKIAFVYLNNEKFVNQGAGYVASTILEAEYDLDFFDSMYIPVKEINDKLRIGNYTLILMSAATLSYPQVLELVRLIREWNKEIIILLGGVHVIVVKGKILEECPDLNYICAGEGEDFILEFLDKLNCGESVLDVPNLGYRTDSGIKINSIRPPTDLTKLCRFHYDLFDPFSITQPYPYPGFCYVYATRGCPYSCTYCCNTRYLELYKGQYLRLRDIDSILFDLRTVRDDYGARFLFFGDEMVIFNEKFVTELFTRIHNEIGLPYGCMARVERITPSIVELFKVTGCGYVGMGVECGDEEFRKKYLNRYMTNEQIINAFRMLKKIPGIKLTSYNMTGYPVANDTELLEKTREFNKLLAPDILQITTFYPFPGTKLYEYCFERNLLDFDKMSKSGDWFNESVIKKVTQ